jgi:pSer/pThr/pTyr-binding forkhead associated (FHA) protein
VADDWRSAYLLSDPLVSNTHLRIHTVIYDLDHPDELSPLVYALDLSRNGTLWNGSPIERGAGGILLSDGDILTLSPDTYLQFRTPEPHLGPYLTKVQTEEVKVSLYRVSDSPLFH